tara:strand:+ start:2006 stop:3001 length:996 start_codon:yes stop_codon:yes gene_type:complete
LRLDLTNIFESIFSKNFLTLIFLGNIFFSYSIHSNQDLIQDCDYCPKMIVIESGNFIKGSPLSDQGSRDDERPQHQVDIDYSFAVGQYEVTRIEYEKFVQSTGQDSSGGCYGATEDGIKLGIGLNWYDPGYPITDNHPVVCVSWNEAIAYTQWLSQETGETYRLLSESEWEYSARAGTTTIRFWGDIDEGCDYANGADLDITPESFLEEMKGRGSKIVLPEDWVVADCHDGYEFSAPVGSFIPNDFEVYDVLGNVAEWVDDCWESSYENAPRDGSARLKGDCDRPILRGASYYDMPLYLRSSNHYGFQSNQSENKDTRYINFGFRVLREMN